LNAKRIALIGYVADYFHNFGETLERSGFEVFWVHTSRSAAREHERRFPSAPPQILDATAGFRPGLCDVERARGRLSELESVGVPRINDIILMDRILREKPHNFALCYIDHLRGELTRYFTENSIALATSGRDTALQLTAMLVCRKLGIPWVAPTRMRIPHETYMFGFGHETADLVRIREVTAQDRVWAEQFLREIEARSPKPLLKAAATDFADVVKMAPRHARVFWALLTKSTVDSGNDYSRYPIPRIIGKYFRRRANLVRFKLLPPYTQPGSAPFCLYALHTQPESSIDVSGSYFSDQIGLIMFISRSLPASHELYVKIHPTDVDGKSLAFYRQIARVPGVRLINYDVSSRDLVARASIVFALTGTIGYEGGLLGKPVITFARNFYNGLPTVHYCDSPPSLPTLISSLLNAGPPKDLRERQLAFLANLKAQSFEGEVNRMYQPNAERLSSQDLQRLGEAYDTVYRVLSAKGVASLSHAVKHG
jgi:hypothetical protein